MKKQETFHSPLHASDTEEQTYGCRHTNPDICSKYHMPKVCAYARPDNKCQSPPASWPKQFWKLNQIKVN